MASHLQDIIHIAYINYYGAGVRLLRRSQLADSEREHMQARDWGTNTQVGQCAKQIQEF